MVVDILFVDDKEVGEKFLKEINNLVKDEIMLLDIKNDEEEDDL